MTVNPTLAKMEEHAQILVQATAVIAPMVIQENPAAAVLYSVLATHVKMEEHVMNILKEDLNAFVSQNLLVEPANIPKETQVLMTSI